MADGAPNPVMRAGGVSYLRIPAPDPGALARFYGDAFGWELGGGPDSPSFTDGTGHVIGHFVSDQAVSGEAGVRPYIFVRSIDQTLARILDHGGEVVTP